MLTSSNRTRITSLTFAAASVVALGSASAFAGQMQAPAVPSQVTQAHSTGIPSYTPRFGRERPVIAVVGENSGTELTDYIIPYGILRRANVADVVALAAHSGPLTMRPALRIQPQATVGSFDERYPDGADYVIVPAVVHRDDPVMLAWIRMQAAKGATLVSICDGALVLAGTGVLNGHSATAHWATRDYRSRAFPNVRWLDNRRYVADGKIVSSAGISAAIPTSLALVEAIGGYSRAAAIARQVGVTDWGPEHNSQIFHPKFGRNLMAFASTNYLNHWFHRQEAVGIPVADGVDEIPLALTADAYTRTGRAKAYAVSVSQQAILTASGLKVLPDRIGNAGIMLSAPEGNMGKLLTNISRRYGHLTAYGVALDFEYPGFNG
jgi:putative intracellular protease/amidase